MNTRCDQYTTAAKCRLLLVLQVLLLCKPAQVRLSVQHTYMLGNSF